MLLGSVIGTTTATVKHPTMQGCKLLIVQPLQHDGTTPDGDPLVAVDTVGAGLGETVMLTSDGRFGREYTGSETTPIRWMIAGIIDRQ